MKRKLFWIGLGLLAVALRVGLSQYPEWIERYYSRGLFLGIRWVIDYLVAWLPVPLIYLFLAGLLLWALRAARRWWRSERPLPERLLSGALSFSAFVGGAVFFFLLLWGFNYGRPGIEQQLSLEVQPLSLPQLREELDQATQRLLVSRRRVPGADSTALTAAAFPPQLERRLREDLEQWLSDQGFPVTGRVRARRLWPRGIFLHFSSSGLYFPWTGEGHVDAGVHALQQPYVMTHELAHGYGFGDEGTCNFLAYLSCIRSSDPFIAYTGHLNYWRTLAANYLRYEPEAYRALRIALPPGVRADLNAINATLEQYPDIMPRLRYYAYDTYLKTQGIEEGMLNYNRVIMLVSAWRRAQVSGQN